MEPYDDTLRAMRGRGDSHLLRLSYLRESLEEAVIDAKRANPKGGDAAVASLAQSAESSLGYPEMHRSELRRLLNTKEYGIKQAELEKMLDGMAAGDAHEARLAQAASGDGGEDGAVQDLWSIRGGAKQTPSERRKQQQLKEEGEAAEEDAVQEEVEDGDGVVAAEVVDLLR